MYSLYIDEINQSMISLKLIKSTFFGNILLSLGILNNFQSSLIHFPLLLPSYLTIHITITFNAWSPFFLLFLLTLKVMGLLLLWRPPFLAAGLVPRLLIVFTLESLVEGQVQELGAEEVDSKAGLLFWPSPGLFLIPKDWHFTNEPRAG